MLPKTLFVAIASGLVAFAIAFLLSVPSRAGAADGPASPPGPETAAERTALEKLVAAELPDVGPLVAAAPASSDAVGAASGSAPAAAVAAQDQDAEWKSFPRPDWRFVVRMRWAPERIRAADLYRHPDLNPLDRYVPPALRESLAALVQAYRPRLVNIRALYTKTSNKELESAIAKGLGERSNVRVPMGDGTFAVQLPANFQRGVVRIDAQGAVLVDRKHLPVTTKVSEYRRFVALELGGQIVNWFERAGLCSSKRAAELLARIAAPVK